MRISIPAGQLMVTVCFVVLSLVAITVAVYSSVVPEGYFFYRFQDRSSFSPEPRIVVLAFLLSATEAGVALALVRPWSYSGSWGRLVVALAVYVPWLALCCSVMGPHIPMFLIVNVVWVAIIVLLLLGALAVTLGTRLWRHGAQVAKSDQVV